MQISAGRLRANRGIMRQNAESLFCVQGGTDQFKCLAYGV